MALGDILGKQGGGGGTLSKIFESVKGTATGIGQQVTGSAAREEALEANRARQKQVVLLEKIEENTKGDGDGEGGDEDKGEEKSKGLLGSVMALFGAIKAFSFGGFVKSMFSGVFNFAGKAVMAGVRAIFNPKNLLKFVTKIFPLAALFGSLANGVWEAFNTFMSGGSIGEVIGSFLGGILEFLSFGLLDADQIKDAFMNALNMFDEWIIQPITGFFTDLGTTISTYWNDYIVSPVMGVIDYLGGIFTGVFETVGGLVDTIAGYFSEYVAEPLGNLFNTYIIDPIKNIFGGVSEFFTDIFDTVISFLEDFGIPAIGFDIPLYGPVEFGPWYPFRTEGSSEGTVAVSSETQMSSSVTEGADGTTETQSSQDYIKSVGSITDLDGSLTDDVTTIMVADSNASRKTDANGNVISENFADNSKMIEFNATTGESTIDGELVDKSVYRAAKRAAEQGGDVAAVQDAIDQQEAYLKLSWWRQARALAGADPRDLLAQQEGDDRDLEVISADRMERSSAVALSGDAVDDGTTDVANASEESTNNVVVVSAPTTNVANNASNNNVAIAPPIRNQESTISRYQAGSYGF